MSFDMYNEHLADSNLAALMNVQDINTITSVANGLLGKTETGAVGGDPLAEATLRARRIQYFYDKVLLDTIKLGSENNVMLKYCQVKEVPEGYAKLLLRRWAGLTEHTNPLQEGIPPKSDMMKSESFEGTFAQFGRFMEFSDRVEFNLIDPVITRMTSEYGDLAIRTAERLCREEYIAMSSKVYAKAASDISTLVIGDNIGIADYRLMALKLARLLVKPLNGSYKVICSPEHLYDLVEDPLVIAYMTYTNTAEPFKTGKPVELFNLSFEQTMLDDFGFNYVGTPLDAIYHPGEYVATAEPINYGLRCYAQVDGVNYYHNFVHGAGATNPKRTVADTRIADGSYIPNKVVWTLAANIAAFVSTDTFTLGDGTTVAQGTLEANTSALLNALIAATWYELPVHKSFMFGQEFMIKTGISGRSGAKIYIKPKGSAGVLDPIDQRQSIGFKIDTLGFTGIRPEAMYTFYFVPTKAAVTQQYTMTYQPTWVESFT